MHHLLAPPDTDVHDLLSRVGSQVYFDLFAEWNIRHFDLMIE